MRLKTSNLLQLCVLTTKSAKESCKEEKIHGLQCTQKPDLQCSEEESKISASIIIIHIIERAFLPRNDLFHSYTRNLYFL